jgi:ATP-dependent exoDNAse (exonuclease V) beta subunit
MPHISFSALKIWKECPYKHKIQYIDKIKKFKGNSYTAFGTAMHEICEEVLLERCTLNESAEKFKRAFIREFKLLPKEMVVNADKKLILDMVEQGRELAPLAIPALADHFGEFEIISSEEEIYEPIPEFEKEDMDFKGFVDLILKTPDGKYHIIDWKTCSWGWDSQKRTEPMTNYQLTLYKHYICLKHDLEPKDVETYFALLKRTAKKNKVEIFRVTSGERKTENALNLLNKALYNITSKNYVKNRLSCSNCEFYKTKHCN